MDDNDFGGRLSGISLAEMRKRCDAAIRHIREMRRAMAVDVGMQLEDVPGPRPVVDMERNKQILEELMETLPLLPRRLTPEEKARMEPLTEERREQLEAVLEELASQPELFDSLMEEGGLPFRHKDVLQMQEDLQKTEMLREVEDEVRTMMAEMQEHRERLEEDLKDLLARATKEEPMQ